MLSLPALAHSLLGVDTCDCQADQGRGIVLLCCIFFGANVQYGVAVRRPAVLLMRRATVRASPAYASPPGGGMLSRPARQRNRWLMGRASGLRWVFTEGNEEPSSGFRVYGPYIRCV